MVGLCVHACACTYVSVCVCVPPGNAHQIVRAIPVQVSGGVGGRGSGGTAQTRALHLLSWATWKAALTGRAVERDQRASEEVGSGNIRDGAGLRSGRTD